MSSNSAAAAANLKLMVKTRNGQFLIDNLNCDDNVEMLKCAIWSKTELHPDTCKVLIGFPPKPLQLSENEKPISHYIKNTRETLILADLDGTTPPTRNENKRPPPQEKEKLIPSSKMKRIEVPSNNSCLFVSVHYCMTGKMKSKCPEMRQLIAQTVRNDPLTYNEGFLGKPNDAYCKWIQDEDHWGGGIELSILSAYYKMEIVAVDTQNIRLNRFGEDKAYPLRIFLIFDGIHYDPLVIESNGEKQTIFAAEDMEVIGKALEVAKVAKEKHQYTDLNNLSLKCNICKRSFTQTSAREHASSTGHVDFSEIKK